MGGSYLLDAGGNGGLLVLVVLASCLGSPLPLQGILGGVINEGDAASRSGNGRPGRDWTAGHNGTKSRGQIRSNNLSHMMQHPYALCLETFHGGCI